MARKSSELNLFVKLLIEQNKIKSASINGLKGFGDIFRETKI